jgi:hypothetical protein
VLAIAVRIAWVLAVPTVPVSDFAMYRESANYLSEFGHLDPGFIYMPGFVALLAWIKDAGGGLLAEKLLGVAAGGLGTGSIFAVAFKLIDDAGPTHPPSMADAPAWRRLCPCPYAAVTAIGFALWPAGVAMSSVVGTDMPAAALLALALALLVTLGPRRRWAAAIAFGAAMGLCAWVRAVALPLSALAAGYWLARRQKLLRAAALTAVGVAATLVVLLPWGIRHARQSGALYFTDDHGGITALIGANPNSEGTYTRALNRMFKDVTGRSVLDEPHHETDRAAFAIAREWFRFEPGYALGLATLKADRLFDPEHRLLYWSIFRPGVLVGKPAAWFAARHYGIARFADRFGLAVAGLALAGVAAALARRRWSLLVLVPFQLAFAATYALFFAEPRYRLPIEMLAFPFAAFALGELAGLVRAALRKSRSDLLYAAKAVGPALVVVVVWRMAWPAMLDAGTGLRARHRWAVTEVAVDGRQRLLLWAPGPPLGAESPLAGSPEGVRVRTDGDQRPGTTLRLRLGGGPLPAGRYTLSFLVDGISDGQVIVAGAETELGTPSYSQVLKAEVSHAGGPLTLSATIRGRAGGSIWIGEATILPAAQASPTAAPPDGQQATGKTAEH